MNLKMILEMLRSDPTGWLALSERERAWVKKEAAKIS